jgi:hypothetical protein
MVLVWCGAGALRLAAQDKVQVKPKQLNNRPGSTTAGTVPNTNETAAAKTGTVMKYFYFPEFYHHWPVDHNDTILKYECYDAHNTQLNVDTITNVNVIQHIYLVKTFTNYMHTFIDVDGKPRPSVVRKTIFRFDKQESDSWKCTEYRNNYITELKEIKTHIVRSDTTNVTDPLTGENQALVRKYYEIITIEPPTKQPTEE